MTCPHCDVPFADTPPMVQTLTVCQNPDCARTLVFTNDQQSVTLAGADDVLRLTPLEQGQLRKLRPAAWRDGVKARRTAMLGKRAR